MSLKTSNYGVARSVLGLIEILFWCGVGLGLIVTVTSAGVATRGFGGSGLLAAVPGIGISLASLIGIAFVQGSKASVDSADYTYQMLKVARDQLSVSQQALKQGATVASFANIAPAPPQASTRNTDEKAPALESGPSGVEVLDWDYLHTRIHRTEHGYLVEGEVFASLDLAKQFVDREAAQRKSVQPNGIGS